MATELFTLLLQGSIIEAVISVYTSVMGNWFWTLLYLVGFIMIYFKSKDFIVTALIGLVMLPLILPLLPSDVHRIIYVFVAMAIAFVIYRVMH